MFRPDCEGGWTRRQLVCPHPRIGLDKRHDAALWPYAVASTLSVQIQQRIASVTKPCMAVRLGRWRRRLRACISTKRCWISSMLLASRKQRSLCTSAQALFSPSELKTLRTTLCTASTLRWTRPALTPCKHVVSAVVGSSQLARRRCALWSAARQQTGGATTEATIQPFHGDTDIFLYPGCEFRVVDAMVTNFHLPESTLMMLVSAFAGIETIRHAYQAAIDNRYRFFSYGDAMFLTGQATR